MNNRTNLLKKRVDTLAEYVVERCARLEKENSWMRQKAMEMEAELTKYDHAFFDALSKIEGIEKLDDGSIHIKFINRDKKENILIILADNFLYHLAKILLEEYERWGMKK